MLWIIRKQRRRNLEDPDFLSLGEETIIMDLLRVTISKSVNVLCYFNVNCFLPLGISVEIQIF